MKSRASGHLSNSISKIAVFFFVILNFALLFLLFDINQSVKRSCLHSINFEQDVISHFEDRRLTRLTEKDEEKNGPLGNPEKLYLHYVRFKPEDAENVTLRFLDYLSILSGVQRLKPDKILLHGDMEPVGKYWDELKRNGWIRYVFREKVMTLSGRIKQLPHLYHLTDVTKLDILTEYGGVAVDFDVYFVRGERIKTILSQHPALTCYGDQDGYNSGLIGASRNSRLLRAWRRSYQVIYRTEWNFNSGDVQKYLSEVFADEVYVANYVCNNPHAHKLGEFFNETGKINWTNSLATHTFHRFSGLPQISGPDDLKGNASSYKEILITIYENRSLPDLDPLFNDRVDPLEGIEF